MTPAVDSHAGAVDEDEDVCRVCRSGAEDGPLFYPCQCTGSIRYVHEPCLNEWLKRSKKTKCELCNTPLAYTIVYSASMPDQLPLHILAKHFVQSLLRGILLVLRAVLVCVAWLAVLPYSSIWVFRFFLVSADGIGSFIHLFSGRVSPEQAEARDVAHLLKSLVGLLSDATGSTASSYAEPTKLDWLAEALRNPPSKTGWASRDTTQLVRRAALGLLGTTTNTPWVAKLVAGIQASERDVVLKQLKNVVVGGKAAREALLGFGQTTPNRIGNLAEIAMLVRERGEGMQVVVEPWRRILGMLAQDTFKGQVLTSCVVVLFVCGFLLREWVMMVGPFPPAPAPPAAPVILPLPPAAVVAGQPPPFLQAPQAHESDNELPALSDVPESSGESDSGEGSDEESSDDDEADDDDERSWEDRYGELTPAPAPRDIASNSRARQASISSWTSSNDHAGPSSRRSLEIGSPSRRGGRRARRQRRRKQHTMDFDAETMDVDAETDDDDDAWEDQPQRSSSPDVPHDITPDDGGNMRLRLDYEPSAAELQFAYEQAYGDPESNDEVSDDDSDVEEVAAALDELIRAAAPPALAVPGAAPAEVVEALPEDDFDGDVLDDFDGVLEAIGMKGSLLVLIQNMGLMNLLIALCLGGAVWVPLCLGRILAASNALRLVTLPLRAVRSLSDPIFDALFSLLAYLPRLALSRVSSTAVLEPAASLAANATLTSLHSTAPPASAVQRALLAVASHWTSMAFDDDPVHRVLCVVLGYATAAFVGFVYLQSTQGAYGQSVNRAIRDGLKQQLVLLKVVLFVFIEIVIFPATCGLILNVATLPLFPDATLWSRIATYSASPISTAFLTWLAGTAFMFSFSTSIDHIRDVVRQGVLFFIRDPATQDFHPIREILERNSGTQAKKIAISAVLYGGAIMLTMGSSIYFLRYAVGVLPLHWTQDRPFALPVDLVIYRFVIPFTLQLIDPGTRIKHVFTHWAKFTAHQLRLTSFIFTGERHPDEEGTQVRRTWRAALLLKKTAFDSLEDGDDELTRREVVFRKDGGFGRVPAIDSIKVVQGRQMIVRVAEDGHPLDDAGAQVIAQQVLEMVATRATDRYQVVYLPPQFKTRIALFVYLLWFTGSLAGMAMVVVPLVVGRYTFSLVTSAPVHDLYALVAGLYVVGTASLAVRHLPAVRLYRPARAHLSFMRAAATAILIAGLALPLFVALFLSCYLLLPFSQPSRPAGEPDFPTIHLVETWAVGTMAVSFIHSIITMPLRRPRVRFDEAIIEAWNNGNKTRALDLVSMAAAWRLRSLAFAVLAPASAAACAWWANKEHLEEAGWTFFHLCRMAYRIAVGIIAAAALAHPASQLATKWLGTLREAEYLVERKLMNFDGKSS